MVNTASVGRLPVGPGARDVQHDQVRGGRLQRVARAGARRRTGSASAILCPGWTNTNLGDASRNRPAALGTAPDQLDIITPGMAEGMDPIDVGRHALRGVRENALYVFTHPEFQPLIADRFAKVIAALERGKEPVKAP